MGGFPRPTWGSVNEATAFVAGINDPNLIINGVDLVYCKFKKWDV